MRSNSKNKPLEIRCWQNHIRQWSIWCPWCRNTHHFFFRSSLLPLWTVANVNNMFHFDCIALFVAVTMSCCLRYYIIFPMAYMYRYILNFIMQTPMYNHTYALLDINENANQKKYGNNRFRRSWCVTWVFWLRRLLRHFQSRPRTAANESLSSVTNDVLI